MNQAKIKKAKLLSILKKNRSEHREVFLEAQKSYRKKVIELLEKNLKEARDGRPFVKLEFVQLSEPKDFTSTYDREIRMLELTEDKVITLGQREFENYVMDKWDWSHLWATSNSSYSSNAKVQAYAAGQDYTE